MAHEFPEAFKLMTYHCETCEYQERLWNARDGVTPFTVDCAMCNVGTMNHIEWEKDVYAPDHMPESGDRVFIDLPEPLKMIFARRSLKALQGHYPMRQRDRENYIAKFVQDFQPGTPYLIRME